MGPALVGYCVDYVAQMKREWQLAKNFCFTSNFWALYVWQ